MQNNVHSSMLNMILSFLPVSLYWVEKHFTIHRHFYGFLLGQKTYHRNDDDHKHDGGDHKNDGGLENQILTFFSRHILLNTRMKKK